MKLAYLCCRETISTGSDRRVDAFEHDQMMQALEGAAEAGDSIDEVLWDDAAVNWPDYDAALIGTTWDYPDREQEFLATLRRIESHTSLFNRSEFVEWNRRKTYLRELEGRGVPAIPTLWADAGAADAVKMGFDTFHTDTLVVKRQIGANAEGQFILRKNEEIPPLPQPVMIQPFIRSIREEGEYSFIFIDGALSHTVLKTPQEGEYRIQSSYGGQEEAVNASHSDEEAACRVMDALDVTPLYARVDMVRGTDGALLLMELELIEPFLYPVQAHGLGSLLLKGLKRRLA